MITFEITKWDEQVVDDADPPFRRIVVHKAYTGDLEGTSTAELLTCAELVYLAVERVSGRLHGKEGTFVVHHGADASGQWGRIVPGTATGQLEGLTGDARFSHGRLELG
jgi:Protein of unknown function (DUF3224)